MTNLASLQDQMQRAILGKPNDAARLVAEPPRGEPAQRLGVYQAAYGLRLTEFLMNDYPKLHAYLGETRFRQMAERYIRATPSHHANARWYARALPDHLKADRTFRRNPEIAELALLERALNDAFDAPDAPVCTMADLALFQPEEFAAVTLAFGPAMSRIAVTTNVTSLWASLTCGETPPGPEDLDVAAEVLVWRQAGSSRFRILGPEEAMALAHAGEGMTFGHLCEMIAAFDDPDSAGLRAAGYLRGWIEAGIVSCMRRTAAGAK